MKIIFLICFILTNSVFGQKQQNTTIPIQNNDQQLINQKNQNDLEMILIITKHGEKGVEFSYPNDPYANNRKIWFNGLNHLTNKGKENSFILGRVLKSEYGQYFKRGSDDIFGVLDESIYSNETITTLFKGMFGTSHHKSIQSSLHADYNHKYALFGPKTCSVLNHRFRRTLKSKEVKQLFNENRALIKNITGSRRNDQKLIKNVPAVYESIQVELNNYLQQPDWLDKKAINKLNEITTKLDKLYYTNEAILELESGQILREFRQHFIDDVFKRPSKYLKDMKFGYTYIVGSDLFSSLLNLFKIYEQRPNFSSTIVIEYDKISNVKLKYYDSKFRKLVKKPIICEGKLVNECKLIPFLQTIDKLIPISLDVSCKIPKSRTISTQNLNYEELFKEAQKDNKHHCNHLDDEDDEDNEGEKNSDESDKKERRKQKRKERIKKYIEKEFKDKANKRAKLIEWLTELFDNFETKLKSSAEEREQISEEQKLNLTNLIEKIIKKSNQIKLEMKENLMKEIDENIESSRTKLNEIFEELEFIIQDYFETKFEELENESSKDKMKTILDNLKTKLTANLEENKSKLNLESNKFKELESNLQDYFETKFKELESENNSNKYKLKKILNNLETKFADNLEENKSKLNLQLNKIKDRMHRLLNEQDNLNESEKQIKINEINQFLNELNEKKLSNELKQENEKYLMLDNLIEELKNLEINDENGENNKEEEDNKEFSDNDGQKESLKLSDTLINKMEETNLLASKKSFDLNKFKSNLNINNQPTKLLRASNEIAPAPAFSPKIFGLTVASVVGLMVLIAIVLVAIRKISKRKEYTKV